MSAKTTINPYDRVWKVVQPTDSPEVVFLGEDMLAPLKWRKPAVVRIAGDLFHDKGTVGVPDSFIDRVMAVIALCSASAGSRERTPVHTFQILTKRPERMREYMGDAETFARVSEAANDMRPRVLLVWPLPNVWLGVSVEDQAEADRRIPPLLRTPAAVRFLSAEPLLGAVACWPHWLREPSEAGCGILDWVICGGESGHGARPMHPDWARGLRDQCKAAGVPFFFKQWGEWWPMVAPYDVGTSECEARSAMIERGVVEHRWAPDQCSIRVGKARAGRRLDGVEHNGMPGVG